MKYKESKLGKSGICTSNLHVHARKDGTLSVHMQRLGFTVNTSTQPARYYREDGTLAREAWYDPVKITVKSKEYNPDGSISQGSTN